MQRLLASVPATANVWRGWRLVAIDKVTLALPEAPALWRRFGSHRTGRGLGTIAVEMACALHVASRVPFAYVHDRANTSEDSLMRRLVRFLRQGDLALIDTGFYSLDAFARLIAHGCHFICPMAITGAPTVIRQLGMGDYLCTIASKDKKTGAKRTMEVRIIYVQIAGFPRRRLVTSLLDPIAYPAAEIAAIYHQRWHIETFFRDFKSTLAGNRWHCRTPETFAQELLMEMILVCLMRRTMLEAAAQRGCLPGRISFARALTAARIFANHLLRASPVRYDELHRNFVKACAKTLVPLRPGRSYPRDPQAIRAKSRGLVKKKPGRPRKPRPDLLPYPEPQTLLLDDGITMRLLP